MDYQRRLIDGVLDELFEELPAILLDGPKAVGKTQLRYSGAPRRKDSTSRQIWRVQWLIPDG